jgi:hypothetical protein
MKKRPSQESVVLDWLVNVGAITSLQARESLGIIDLPKRISVLRARHGQDFIKGERITVNTRYGKTTVMRYTIA